MNLQGVHPIEFGKRKQWKTVEGNKSDHYILAQDENGFKGVALEPQRMRSFLITYNQPAESLKAEIKEKD